MSSQSKRRPKSSSGAGAWRIALTVPGRLRREFAAALESITDAVAFTEPNGRGASDIEAVATHDPDRVKIAAALALLSAGFGIPEPKFQIEHLAEQDWLAVSNLTLAPIRVGRFFIRDSGFAGAAPDGAIAISIEFGGAFGTGRHESTQGCLHALALLARRGRVRNLLDLGCGSGILTVAALKLWRARGLACDIDPESVRIARTSFVRNGLAARARAEWADHPGRRAVARHAPYDLIAANIMVRPLKTMARGLKRVLAPGGRIILSGFLTHDAVLVENHYRALGLRRIAHRDAGSWRTLVMSRPARPRPSSLVPGRSRP